MNGKKFVRLVALTATILLIGATLGEAGGKKFSENIARSLFSDKRGYQVGDVVTILIVEYAIGQHEAGTETGSDSEFGVSAVGSGDLSDTNMGADAAWKHKFDGTGGTKRSGSVEGTMSARIVEIFHRGNRVASHRRSFKKGPHTTIAEHLPRAHREYLKWTPQRLLNWAAKTGPACEGLARAIMNSRAHPQQGFRSVLGIMRLGKIYGDERLESAWQRALDIRARSLKSVKSILKNNMDKKPTPLTVQSMLPIEHQNIRGKDYYAPKKGEINRANQPHHGQTDRHETHRNGQGPGRTDGNAGS